jgi:hypothetical protein
MELGTVYLTEGVGAMRFMIVVVVWGAMYAIGAARTLPWFGKTPPCRRTIYRV